MQSRIVRNCAIENRNAAESVDMTSTRSGNVLPTVVGGVAAKDQAKMTNQPRLYLVPTRVANSKRYTRIYSNMSVYLAKATSMEVALTCQEMLD